jgi:hypothetical protein
VVTQEDSTKVSETFHRIASTSASGGSYDSVGHTTKGDNGGRPYYRATFRGTHVTIYGTRSAGSGKAAVYIDNAKRATITLNSTTSAYRSLLWGSPTLSDKQHTIRIEVVGTSSGSKSAVGIDYLAVS